MRMGIYSSSSTSSFLHGLSLHCAEGMGIFLEIFSSHILGMHGITRIQAGWLVVAWGCSCRGFMSPYWCWPTPCPNSLLACLLTTSLNHDTTLPTVWRSPCPKNMIYNKKRFTKKFTSLFPQQTTTKHVKLNLFFPHINSIEWNGNSI